MDSYLVIARDADVEIEVRRSRFLTRLRRVEDEDGARAVIDDARRDHRTARHHCTAFVLGPAGAIARSNDDGEPPGTAGLPMLEALRGAEVSDVVAVVIRYFGGIKLGTGGLVRAYTDAVVAGLEAAGTVRRGRMQRGTVLVPVAEAGRIENELRGAEVAITGIDYGVDAAISVAVPAGTWDDLEARVAALTGGEGLAEPGAQDWVDLPGRAGRG